MTDRRRNGLILLLVAGLMAASAVVVATKKTRLGLDLKGGVELVYQAKPTPAQPKITQETLDQYVKPNMPPLHYALCGCEDLPGYPQRWK